MIHDSEKTCPRCRSPKMKSWIELTDEEKFLAERLPMSAEYTAEQRKQHRFCARCWYEDDSKTTLV